MESGLILGSSGTSIKSDDHIVFSLSLSASMYSTLIGDRAIWNTQACNCGLHSQVIKDIQGRSEDYIITPEGTHIQRFDYLFKDTADIKECQVVQRQLGFVTFRMVIRDNYSTTTEQKIKKAVRKMISPSIICEFEYVSEIERTSAGKFKAVVSELNK